LVSTVNMVFGCVECKQKTQYRLDVSCTTQKVV
jgi:hypothetical protein